MKQRRLDKSSPRYKEFDRQYNMILRERNIERAELDERIKRAKDRSEKFYLASLANPIDKECSKRVKELMNEFEDIYIVSG